MRHRLHFVPLAKKAAEATPPPSPLAAPAFKRAPDKPQQKTNRVTGPHQVTISESERRKAVQLFDGMFPAYAGLLNATVIAGGYVKTEGKTAKKKAKATA